MPQSYADRDDAGEQRDLQQPDVQSGDAVRPRGGEHADRVGQLGRPAPASPRPAPRPARGPAPRRRPRRTGGRAAARRGSASAACGRRPSGSSSSTASASGTTTAEARSVAHTAQAAPVRCPASTHAVPSAEAAKPAPTPSISQPSGLRGRPAATSAPGRAQKTGSTNSLPGVSSPRSPGGEQRDRDRDDPEAGGQHRPGASRNLTQGARAVHLVSMRPAGPRRSGLPTRS